MGKRSAKVTIHQSSKTAPHFGHFVSVSSTSAPQFVHVNAATFEAFPPEEVSRFGPVFFSSFGSSPARVRVFIRASRERLVYHQRKSIPKYVNKATRVAGVRALHRHGKRAKYTPCA